MPKFNLSKSINVKSQSDNRFKLLVIAKCETSNINLPIHP